MRAYAMSETRLQPGDDRPYASGASSRSTMSLATVDVGGVKRQVNIACIVDAEHPVEACVGDWVLIHVGFAMSRIDEAEAAQTLRMLTELGEAQQELEAMRRSAPNREARVMANEGDLKALYPFLHGRPQAPAGLDAALLHSVEEKARRLARNQRPLLCAEAPILVAAAKASPMSTGAAAGCSRWAMAARVAMRRMSRSNSCIRSRRDARRWPRSISSPTSR